MFLGQPLNRQKNKIKSFVASGTLLGKNNTDKKGSCIFTQREQIPRFGRTSTQARIYYKFGIYVTGSKS